MHKKMFFIASLLILWISSIFLYVGTPSLPPDLKEVFISVQGAIPLIPFATIDAPGQLTQHEKNYFNAANNHRNSTPLGGGNGLVTKKFTSSGTGNSFEDFLYMTGGFPGTSAAIPFCIDHDHLTNAVDPTTNSLRVIRSIDKVDVNMGGIVWWQLMTQCTPANYSVYNSISGKGGWWKAEKNFMPGEYAISATNTTTNAALAFVFKGLTNCSTSQVEYGCGATDRK